MWIDGQRGKNGLWPTTIFTLSQVHWSICQDREKTRYSVLSTMSYAPVKLLQHGVRLNLSRYSTPWWAKSEKLGGDHGEISWTSWNVRRFVKAQNIILRFQLKYWYFSHLTSEIPEIPETPVTIPIKGTCKVEGIVFTSLTLKLIYRRVCNMHHTFS